MLDMWIIPFPNSIMAELKPNICSYIKFILINKINIIPVASITSIDLH